MSLYSGCWAKELKQTKVNLRVVVTFSSDFLNDFYGAASRYGSGSGSTKMMQLLTVLAPQHW
jgi:hypothetical protein